MLLLDFETITDIWSNILITRLNTVRYCLLHVWQPLDTDPAFNFQKTRDISASGEQWSVLCEYFWEKWPCYKEIGPHVPYVSLCILPRYRQHLWTFAIYALYIVSISTVFKKQRVKEFHWDNMALINIFRYTFIFLLVRFLWKCHNVSKPTQYRPDVSKIGPISVRLLNIMARLQG